MTVLGRALAKLHHTQISLPRASRIADALGGLIVAAGGAATLLDVGSGDGLIAARVADALDASVEGVDVLLQADAVIAVRPYDGAKLPFDDDSFDVVLLSDVLHHASAPHDLLRECLRVARRGVALKDHFTFGRLSNLLLWLMDEAGNAASGVKVRGHYLERSQWDALLGRAGGRFRALRWPLVIHDLPWRIVTRSELQFAAFVEDLNDGAS